MSGQDADSLRAVFDRAAERLKLSGRRRVVGFLYFVGRTGKEMRHAAKVTEGTMKRDLVFLHGLLRTSNRAEFVHRIYEIANG
jgi:hypothetical protein